MKQHIFSILFLCLLPGTCALQAQSISAGKQTLEKQEMFGLSLNENIAEKYLTKYWESYLDRFGKVKGKRSIYSIEKASVPSISNLPVQLSSQINSGKSFSQVFLALFADGQYVTEAQESKYQNAR